MLYKIYERRTYEKFQKILLQVTLCRLRVQLSVTDYIFVLLENHSQEIVRGVQREIYFFSVIYLRYIRLEVACARGNSLRILNLSCLLDSLENETNILVRATLPRWSSG